MPEVCYMKVIITVCVFVGVHILFMGFYQYGNEPTDSMKARELFWYLSKYLLLREDSATCS